MLTGSGPTGRTGPAALPAVPAAAAGLSNLGRSAAAPQREASGWEGTTSGHPSAGTARPSSSAMSGERGWDGCLVDLHCNEAPREAVIVGSWLDPS